MINYKKYEKAVIAKQARQEAEEDYAWSEANKGNDNLPIPLICTGCNSTAIQKWGTYTTTRKGKIQKYKCTSCGKVFTQPQGNGANKEE